MTSHRRRALAAAALFVSIHAGAHAQQQAPAASAPAAQAVEVQGGRVRVVTVATGLTHPWSIALLPDGRTMLVSERIGRVRVIRDLVLDPEPAWTVDRAGGESNDRLKWVAIHPRFAENRLVYLSYPVTQNGQTTLAVARGRFDGAKLVDVAEIFTADAWETGGNLGGKLLFGPDESLYVTVGDRDRICCNGSDDNSLRLKAQDLSTHVGKTLRIRDDGSVPPDNPFVGRAGAKPEIFTYGHRNGYGLAFHPDTGELWQAEIGPMGGDEVNILLPGHNYGWPLVSMGRNYTGSHVSDQWYHRDGMDDPRMFWVPSISPSSLAFYTGDKFPSWKNSMLVGLVERSGPATRVVRPAVAGRTARAVAAAAQRPHPRRPAGPRRVAVRRDRNPVRRQRGGRHGAASRAARRVVAARRGATTTGLRQPFARRIRPHRSSASQHAIALARSCGTRKLPSAESERQHGGLPMRAHTSRSAVTRLAAVTVAFGALLPLQPSQAADLDAVAARVQVLEDREDIRALILAYGAAHDHRDYRTFSTLFAAEGEWVGGLGSAKGPDAIFNLMDRTIGHDPRPNGSGTFHVMTNDQIKIAGDTAEATTKWIYITPGDDNAPKLVYLGHYDDKFIRENGVWKFLRREAPADIPVPK